VAAAEAWIRTTVEPTGPLELERARAWASIFRIPLADGTAWFKACAETQAFEPQLTASLAARWPDRVARVLAYDSERRWLLSADAGNPVAAYRNDPAIWLRALPLYAELQIGEVRHVAEHLGGGVPDRRIGALPAMYDRLVAADLPIELVEIQRLAAFGSTFERWCAELASADPTSSIQHDDLHLRSLFIDGSALRFLDWGDACIAHPFATLVVTFHWLERENGLPASDAWFARLRDAYLEPWGRGRAEVFDLAMRIGLVAEAIGWLRQRDAMPAADRIEFDVQYAELLRRVIARVVEPA
jgi:hypothetical protein